VRIENFQQILQSRTRLGSAKDYAAWERKPILSLLIGANMASKAKTRRKTISARSAKPVPASRKRRIGRPAKTVDPLLALQEHREKLEALFEEACKLQEATLQGISRLVETSVAQARSVSEKIAEEVEKLDVHCRNLKKKHVQSSSIEDESGAQGQHSELGLIQDAA
jgi:hypothetical protein